MSLQPRVALGDNFLTAFAALPKQQQRGVSSFVTKFRANPRGPGINYETIRNAHDRNFRSVRIDQNYRGIVLRPEKGDVYILLWVDKHDDAYTWATRHRCAIHPGTGVLQLFEVETSQLDPATAAALAAAQPDDTDTVVDVATDDAAASTAGVDEGSVIASEIDVSRAAVTPPAESTPLFRLDNALLLRLGVPTERLPLIHALTSEEELERAEPRLPIEAFEALYLLAAGEPLQQILDEYAAPASTRIDTEDFESALSHPGTQRRFYVPEDEQELARMLNAPLERWRVFLHPTQRKLVERNWNGPVRVLGGAGTGKTVVAMHRARWLVAQSDWPKTARLLFTTFSRNLAMDIEHNLKKICTPEQMGRIEVVNLDSWVSRFVRRNEYESTIAYPHGKDGIYDRCWESAMAIKPSDPMLPDSFYHEEWERVVSSHNIRSKKEYLFADRKGRGVALTRRLRAAIWNVFEEMREQLARANRITAADATHHAVDILNEGADNRRYHAVVVDETQDFGRGALQLLRHLVKEQANDLFLVGDAHQRIYQQQVPMSHCGINIIGRGRKLKINYRTTERIRDYAMGVLSDIEIDDLDGGIDSSTGYKSLVVGEVPQIHHADTRDAEIDWITGNIEALEREGIPMHEIAIVARTNRLCNAYAHALECHGIPVHRLSRQYTDELTVPGVRVATMHRVKGLEYRCIMIAGVNNDIVPLRQAMTQSSDPVEKRLRELNERALLHVAATRAIKHLFISSYGEKSSFLE